MKRAISLNGNWDLYYFPQNSADIKAPDDLQKNSIPKVSATVPGNVEVSLNEAGIIKGDLFKGMKTVETSEYEDYEWWYKKEFDSPEINPEEKIFITFGAVDCFADYYINGEKVYSSDNAFIEQSFEITHLLKKNGKNIVYVNIKSAAMYAYSREYNKYLADSYNGFFQAHIRKPAHCFGWDIFPRCITAGLWRDVSLEIYDKFSICELTFNTVKLEKSNATVRFQAITDMPYSEYKKDIRLRINATCGEHSFNYEHNMNHVKTGTFQIDIKNARLWWPYGYGKANVYDLTCELTVDGNVKDIFKTNLGIRTVELIRTETLEDKNSCFKFNINGVNIMCRGSNWVPLDAYHSRIKKKYQKALCLFTESHCNMVRVWGGGVYEETEFYDYCDRHGIMVWQDFMMACRTVDMSDAMLKQIEKEAVFAVKKLRNHPSLVLWAGDNEMDESLSLAGKAPGTNRITREIIPHVIAQNDNGRPYLPSSPYIPDSHYKKYTEPYNDYFVERHLWGPRDYYKSPYYANSKAHFVSETGYHGCPCADTIMKTVDSDKVWPVMNEQWSLHSSDQEGKMHRVELMRNQIKVLFDFEPENLEDFITASQISQAEADKYFIERIRTRKPYTSGILWWNMIDGWPQMSDAVVDYFFEKKLAFDYIKRCQEPFAIMIGDLDSHTLNVVASNDTIIEKFGTYKVYDIDTDEVISEGSFSLEPNANKTLSTVKTFNSAERFYVIEWTTDGKTYYNHYLYGAIPYSFEAYRNQLEKFYKLISSSK